MAFMVFDLVMFDLDGTLVETAPEIADAVNDTLADLVLPAAALEQVTNWIGHGTRELLVQALAQAWSLSGDAVRADARLPDALARFDTHYQQHCGTRSHLYPQVRETLLNLRAKGTLLAVVTNKESRYTRTVLDAHHLTPLFDCVVSGDSFAQKKPNPMGVYACMKQFDVPPQRCLFVGDSSIDVATARNADVSVWVLPYGYNMGQPIEASRPDRVITDMSALLASA